MKIDCETIGPLNRKDGGGIRPPLALHLCAALLVAGVGLVTLLGWIVDRPILTTFGSSNIPMAPSTAFFFLFYGGSVFFLTRTAPGRGVYRTGMLAGTLALAVVVLLFFLSVQGVHSPIEHLGLKIAGAVGDVPIGHMSPLTACCFALAGASFLAGLSSTSGHRVWAMTAFGFASLVSLVSFALLLAYALGAPLLYGSGVIPPALPTALAFLLLGISLQVAAGARVWPSADNRLQSVDPRASYLLGMIFAFLVVGIITTGFRAFRYLEREHRASEAQKLAAIVTFKAERIANWLGERQGQGEALAANREFAERVGHWLATGGDSEHEVVSLLLGGQFAAHDYEGVVLLNSDGRQEFSLGEGLDISGPLPSLVRETRVSGKVLRSELYQGVSGKLRLAWVVPISRWGADGSQQALATVILHVGPERFLFPFIEAWPGGSRTAETQLLRRDGEEVLFLNNLRHHANAALNLRIPLARGEVPAVQAALGRKGITEGIDYRGVPVLAALGAVSGSSWFVVGRMELAEINAALRGRLWLMVLVINLLLLGAGAGVALLWRRQLYSHRFALLTAVAGKDRRLAIELEERVAERTAQLEAANLELEAFSYSVSHDLKAPLRGIDGYSRLLEEAYCDKLDGEGRTFLGNIRQGVAQMHELIEDLLAYSRMERRVPNNVALDLSALVRAVAADCEMELRKRGVGLRLMIPAITVHADREGLIIALRNLLENAIKFSLGAEGPSIEIGACAEEGRALLWVRDNGIGFDMKFHGCIFEIFSRLERAEEFPGTGVGLALVRKAMQRMGGQVWAESAPGQGASFFLELPL